MSKQLPSSRELPIMPGHTAILFVDTQNYNCLPTGGQYEGLTFESFDDKYGYFFECLDTEVKNNWVRLQKAFRHAGHEVVYTVMESLTLDGRDRSLDYKISNFNIPRGSYDAQVIKEIAPQGDEIVFSKSSCSVFISTNIDYILRNLQIRSLVIAGVLTDQCIDSAVRDACDLGYLVTVVDDACATHSAERHHWALSNNKGYCRQISTQTLIDEVSSLTTDV